MIRKLLTYIPGNFAAGRLGKFGRFGAFVLWGVFGAWDFFSTTMTWFFFTWVLGSFVIDILIWNFLLLSNQQAGKGTKRQIII